MTIPKRDKNKNLKRKIRRDEFVEFSDSMIERPHKNKSKYNRKKKYKDKFNDE